MTSKILHVQGMTCPNCEMRIENALKKINGVAGVKARYSDETVMLSFDALQNAELTAAQAIAQIEKLGYAIKTAPDKNSGITNLLIAGIVILLVYIIINKTVGFNFIPEITEDMGYGLLFAVGALTSLHCIAMCGGINLSQCIAYRFGGGSRLLPSILYNLGRVVSYTLIGGIVGAIGSVISFSGSAKGFVSIAAGVFMVIMGINMLNIFPYLRKFMPRMPKIFGNKISNSGGKYGPLAVGLLNGLMPCGPLQSMQIYALGTGSFLTGALSMFMFSLGTVPLMFGFGAASSLLSSQFTDKMLKAGAVLVMLLGIIMLNRGLALSGINTIVF